MFGWYSESIAKMGDVHICKDKHDIKVLCTSITNTNQCPYLEESVFGSDVISIGELKEYVSKMKYESYN
tara:strand:+ start:475 stop:681 length:207 start_codon:yes stop_codon:yes gene_type:complete